MTLYTQHPVDYRGNEHPYEYRPVTPEEFAAHARAAGWVNPDMDYETLHKAWTHLNMHADWLGKLGLTSVVVVLEHLARQVLEGMKETCATCHGQGWVDERTCPNVENSPCRDMGCGHDCPDCTVLPSPKIYQQEGTKPT